MQRPATPRKRLMMGHRQCVQGDCSTDQEALRNRLLSARVNENYGDVSRSHALVGSVPLGLRKFRMREIKASVEDVVGEDEVAVKTAPLERKKIQSTKSFFIWQFPYAFDHSSRQALYALHEGDVSLKVR